MCVFLLSRFSLVAVNKVFYCGVVSAIADTVSVQGVPVPGPNPQTNSKEGQGQASAFSWHQGRGTSTHAPPSSMSVGFFFAIPPGKKTVLTKTSQWHFIWNKSLKYTFIVEFKCSSKLRKRHVWSKNSLQRRQCRMLAENHSIAEFSNELTAAATFLKGCNIFLDPVSLMWVDMSSFFPLQTTDMVEFMFLNRNDVTEMTRSADKRMEVLVF